MNYLSMKFPVIRSDGAQDAVHVWEITSEHETNPVIDFNFVRSDFNGSFHQLIIGLFQCLLMPKDDTQWDKLLSHPPSPNELKKRFEPLQPAFEIIGDGPRFMQDHDAHMAGKEKPISALLIEAPGENTIKNNSDHFIKRGNADSLCACCTATALFCLQTNAPSGGQGHRTSLRGGGPLTSLIKARTLWESVCFAILPQKNWFSGIPKAEAYQDFKDHTPWFPWLHPTVDSSGNKEVKPRTVHPFQLYFAMPRRIRLNEPVMASCDLCDQEEIPCFQGYRTLNYGNRYTDWVHPLSAHYTDKKGQTLTRLGQPGDRAFDVYLGFVYTTGDKVSQPAAIVTKAFERQEHWPDDQLRLWIFGYDMDNMKARSYIDKIIPLFPTDPTSEDVAVAVEGMVKTTKLVASNTVKAFKEAGFSDTKVKGDLTHLEERLWHAVAPKFYENLINLSSNQDLEECRTQWFNHIGNHSLEIFNEQTQIRTLDVSNVKRWAEAHNKLKNFNKSKVIHKQWPGANL